MSHLHWPKLTTHTKFLPEVDLGSVLLTSRTVWPQEQAPDCRPSHCLELEVLESNMNEVSRAVPKPFGQVSEVSKGGYSLPKVLGWEHEVYKAVQAGS